MTEEAMEETTEETTEKKVVKVFQSTHCEPCHEIVGLINEGKYILDIEDAEVQVIDVTSEEGFPELEKEDVDALPSAKYEGKTCRLGINREEGIVTIDCKEPEVEDESQGPE
ncbi:hypothetical protein ES703_86072 [subsurface metagenome]